jgi:hypothetical protein
MTFMKWRLTPSYAAKDTIFCQKRPKSIAIRIIVLDDKNSNLFISPSMWTHIEHAHCLETNYEQITILVHNIPLNGSPMPTS